MLSSDDRTDASMAMMADLDRRTTPHRIAALQPDLEGVTVDWSDGRRTRFHVLWLRDNCACPKCRHPQALERTYTFLDHARPLLAAAVIDANGDINARFKQGTELHDSRFAKGWLRAHDPAEIQAQAQRLTAQPWNADICERLTKLAYSDFMHGAQAMCAWISAIKTDGIVLLQEVPQVAGKLLDVARRIGPVRHTNFGDHYDVVSMPKPNASAYTAMGLELHTDLANWRVPPDVQLLFCLKSSVTGGESVFADGFRAAEELRRMEPAAFEVLATHCVDFRFHDDTCDIRTSARVIETDRDGTIRRIRFNNWLRSATVFPDDVVEPFYAALGRFWALLREPAMQLHRRLAPGELIAYDNNRILHGRAPFDANSGERHLQGCYVNLEDVDSTFRLLERRAG